MVRTSGGPPPLRSRGPLGDSRRSTRAAAPPRLPGMTRPPPAPAPPYGETGARLGGAVLAFVAAVVGAITLQPFRFAWPARVEVMLWSGWFDALANVALFVPLGFVYG